MGFTQYTLLILIIKRSCTQSFQIDRVADILRLDGLTAAVDTTTRASHNLDKRPITFAGIKRKSGVLFWKSERLDKTPRGLGFMQKKYLDEEADI